MSDTTAIVLIFLLGVLVMAGCVLACVLVGRYYARRCAESLARCAEVDERVDYLLDQMTRER